MKDLIHITEIATLPADFDWSSLPSPILPTDGSCEFISLPKGSPFYKKFEEFLNPCIPASSASKPTATSEKPPSESENATSTPSA
jgi:hypothetical protein